MIRILLHVIFVLLNLYSTQKLFGLHPMSLFSVGCIAFSLLLERKTLSASTSSKKAGLTIGIIFSLFTSFAHYGYFSFSSFGASVFYMILFTVGLSFSFSIISICVYDEMEKAYSSNSRNPSGGKVFFSAWAVIFIVWLLFFLAYYPGIYSPDSLWQLEQAMGDSPLSNHHPVIHTLLMRFVLHLGKNLFSGSLQAATGLLSVIQMLFLSLCMAYSIKTISEVRRSSPLYMLFTLFFALVPFNIMFSFTHLKDTWFAGFFLVFCSILAKRLSAYDHLSRVEYILFALSAIGAGLFRSNGLYAILFLLPFLFFTFKKDRLLSLVLVVCLIVCFIITGPVYKTLGVIAIDPVEYLSVPLQQISRVIVDGGKISDSDYSLLSEVINPSLIPSAYYSRISDNIKNLIRTSGNQEFISDNKASFLLLWLRLLKDNPGSYINAYVDLSNGFWYPEQTGIPFVTSMDPNAYGLSVTSLLPTAVTNVLRMWTYSNNQQSFLGPVFSCGGYVWAFLFLFIYSLSKKGKAYVTFLPSLFLWITLLLTTPVYCDIRYLYAIIVCLPLLFTVAINLSVNQV